MIQTLQSQNLAVLLMLVQLARMQLSPDYCWTLASNTGSVPDGCTSPNSLTRQLGAGLGPFCDASGCSFETNAKFYLDLSSLGIAQVWTLGIWASFQESTSQTLFEIENAQSGAPSLLQVERISEHLKVVKVGDATQQVIGSEWGSQEWVFVFANSGNGFTEIGTYFRQSFSSFNINGETDLSNASLLSIGNNAGGTAPVRLIKRVQFYSGVRLTSSSSPYTLGDVVANQECMGLETRYFCEDAYVYYKMNPSYLDQEQVTDSSGNGYHAINGIDISGQKNALSLEKGLRFYGDDLVTASTVSVSAYSFTISVWFLLNPGYGSVLQTIFKEDSNKLVIQFKQSDSLLLASFQSESVSLNSATFDSSGYNLVSVSVSPASATEKYVVLSMNGDFSQGVVSSTHFPITSFTLGENFQGTMRQFSIFKHFMGYESFYA